MDDLLKKTGLPYIERLDAMNQEAEHEFELNGVNFNGKTDLFYEMQEGNDIKWNLVHTTKKPRIPGMEKHLSDLPEEMTESRTSPSYNVLRSEFEEITSKYRKK